MAAANLSSAKFLEGDDSLVLSLANIAISYNQFNLLSIVNNDFVDGSQMGARTQYLEAMGVMIQLSQVLLEHANPKYGDSVTQHYTVHHWGTNKTLVITAT